MCGIAGLVSLTNQPLGNPELVRLMTDRLVHRGPDEAGYYVNPTGTVALGHRRLRIIDLASGRQPLGNEDGSVMVVFNGEIYGFMTLAEELRERGHRFTTRTDTEVIVHLYEEDGKSCLQRLKGMFAFALWDERRRSLLLARDRMGKKPLYYTIVSGLLAFASEPSALVSLPMVSREADETALDLYMTYGYIPAPWTVYHHIRKLQAGQVLTVEIGRADAAIEFEQYWSPLSGRPVRRSEGWEESKQQLVARLRAVTAERMVSDVPVGCFLSGGVDSSTVLSFMAELSPMPVKTFSIGFPEEELSELPYARDIARHFGTDHQEFVLEPDGIAILDRLVSHFGEPFADSSALPTWYLSQLTRKSVTVALTGDGGDELFGGYPWYRTGPLLEWASQLPAWVRNAGAFLAKGVRPRAARRIEKVRRLLALSSSDRYARLRQITSPDVKRMIYTPAFFERTGEAALRWLADRYEESQADGPGSRMMKTDLVTYLAEDLLVKVDRTSMAHALECRCPFLDVDVVEWSLALPERYKIRSGWSALGCYQDGKRILKEAVRDRFPPGFLDRPKQGFTVPLERWFRRDLQYIVEERLFDARLLDPGTFDRQGLRRLAEEHFSGQADHASTVWALLVFATWREQYAV